MKPAKIIGVVIIVIALGAGGYFILHKPATSAAVTNTGTTSQTPDSTAPDVNNTVLTTKTSASLGKYLTDPSGKPLYTYGADTNSTSNCTGSCLSSWPAYQATASTADLPAGISTIKRSDNGEMQYTYNGMPLYYFASDTGSTPTGDGVANFSLAKPSAGSTDSATTTPVTPSSSSSASSSASDW